MKNEQLRRDFLALKKIIKKYNNGSLEARSAIIGSKAAALKEGFHLYGKKSVSIAGRKPQQTYIAGIILQKHFVGFYFMPIYSHPQLFKIKDPELQKFLKGKSCFNIKKFTPETKEELEDILKQGIALYRKEKWI